MQKVIVYSHQRCLADVSPITQHGVKDQGVSSAFHLGAASAISAAEPDNAEEVGGGFIQGALSGKIPKYRLGNWESTAANASRSVLQRVPDEIRLTQKSIRNWQQSCNFFIYEVPQHNEFNKIKLSLPNTLRFRPISKDIGAAVMGTMFLDNRYQDQSCPLRYGRRFDGNPHSTYEVRINLFCGCNSTLFSVGIRKRTLQTG
ncbi:hypothetical protein BDK51DRAFT_41278 [Blyttiomyces helicus]|uniref:Uncharacterized protein n=1 Tax=Blyttiomyces helicus TaxID=388810 RepID=A0A4P9WPG4_9FUNG|nr:hypothetical protein BDK51DRAFT_41278 [Blyttiomyces helicus]|eukprot:RKO94215.1 hypothetical protein BDK51DRAFT_41278 [Blyttiomyces helicus]